MTEQALRRRDRARWLRLALGVALSAVALWLAFRRTSPAELGAALSRVSWPWLPAMVALKAGVLVVKDLRWRVELNAMAAGTYRRTFRALGLGYFGNLLLPFKLGELLRVGLLKRHNPEVSPGAVLATVAAERAIDGLVLALLVGAALPLVAAPPWIFRGTLILLAVMLGVIFLSLLTPVHAWVERRFPERGLLRWGRRVVAALSRGTTVLRRPRAFAACAALTALAWLGEATVFYCAIRALALDLGFLHALVVTLLLSIGLLIPSAPGQIGTHQALCVLFLAPFAVERAAALSVSILLQAVAITTLGSIGGYVLVRESAARELVRESREPEES